MVLTDSVATGTARPALANGNGRRHTPAVAPLKWALGCGATAGAGAAAGLIPPLRVATARW
jgi:hypothetical protein